MTNILRKVSANGKKNTNFQKWKIYFQNEDSIHTKNEGFKDSLPNSRNKNKRKLIANDHLDILWGKKQYYFSYALQTLEEKWGNLPKTKNDSKEFWIETGNLGLDLEGKEGKWVFGISKEEEIMDEIEGFESTKVEVWRPYLGRIE